MSRTKPRPAQPEIPKRFERNAILATPGVASVLPRPHGLLDAAPIEVIRRTAREVWGPDDKRSRTASRDRGLRRLLTNLEQHSGTTWQQRWEAAGLNQRGRPVRELAQGEAHQAELTQGLEAMLCLRIIQPTLEALRSNHFTDLPRALRVASHDPLLDGFFTAVETRQTTVHWKRRAVFDISVALITQGIALADLNPEALLHYARHNRDARMGAWSCGNYVGHLAWDILYESGHFPCTFPVTLRAALRTPQYTCQEMVAKDNLRNHDVAKLLLSYLERRSHDMDYSTIKSLAIMLVRIFWKAIETINPEQADLRPV